MWAWCAYQCVNDSGDNLQGVTTMKRTEEAFLMRWNVFKAKNSSDDFNWSTSYLNLDDREPKKQTFHVQHWVDFGHINCLIGKLCTNTISSSCIMSGRLPNFVLYHFYLLYCCSGAQQHFMLLRVIVSFTFEWDLYACFLQRLIDIKNNRTQSASLFMQ